MLNLRKTMLERNHIPWPRRSRTVLLSMCFLCAIAGALWLSATSSVRSSPNSPRAAGDRNLSSFARINEKARTARGGNPTAIRELADEVFDAVGFPEIPARTQDEMKERIVRSEIDYRSTGKGGIPEKNIVKMINSLAQKLDLPDYARVDGMLVRQVRVRMFTQLPNLFSQAVTMEEKGRGGVGSALKTEMSPVEATFLASFLLQQKQLNEAYQLTPKEWRADLHQKQIQRWQAFRKFKDGGGKAGELPREQPREGFFARETSAKSIKMSEAMSGSKAKMKLSDLQSLANASLDDLGVAK
jgi:hypothetical protein